MKSVAFTLAQKFTIHLAAFDRNHVTKNCQQSHDLVTLLMTYIKCP